jgi:protein dithiol:quinone oxidoreductase
LLPSRPLKLGLGVVGLALAASGVAAAIYQNRVAAQEFSCNLTLADRIISALGLESAVPFLFRISASCMEAAVDLLGLPYEAWSGMLFLIVGGVLILGMRSR